jgi:hypothetical protein
VGSAKANEIVCVSVCVCVCVCRWVGLARGLEKASTEEASACLHRTTSWLHGVNAPVSSSHMLMINNSVRSALT